MQRALGVLGVLIGIVFFFMAEGIVRRDAETPGPPELAAKVVAVEPADYNGRARFDIYVQIDGENGATYRAKSARPAVRQTDYVVGDNVRVQHLSSDRSEVAIVKNNPAEAKILLRHYGVIAVLLGVAMAFGHRPLRRRKV
ncbi:MAG: hypothetical protein AAGC95_13580 [Pseudomonadota bacterium]